MTEYQSNTLFILEFLLSKTIKSISKENKRKKRKAKAEEVAGSSTTEGVTEEETQPTGRDWTLSIALPGSILDNAQSFELRFTKSSIFGL